MRLPSNAFQEVTWREGTDRKLRSRFAAVRVRPAHRDYEKAEPHAEEWLLITIMDALGGSSLIQSA
jgi:SRSO17 transposase